MHACRSKVGGKGEGPCRPTVERQARRKTMADTAPMGPDTINDGRNNLRERCMHAHTDGRFAQILVTAEKQKYPNHEACHMSLSRSNNSN